jgi:hypothetical protein
MVYANTHTHTLTHTHTHAHTRQLLELHSALYAVIAAHQFKPDRSAVLQDMKNALHE